MGDSTAYEGGCLCGKVRYRLTAPPDRVSNCHCSMCRRASGSLFQTWAIFSSDAFSLTQGQLAELRMTPVTTRRFCSSCGSPITFLYRTDPHEVAVSLGTFDPPLPFKPDAHLWITAMPEWSEQAQHLPRHPYGRDEVPPPD